MLSTVSRPNLKMFLLIVSALLLPEAVCAQEMPYEDYLTQMKECPKECSCPPSIPNAVYCDNKGLKSIPAVPPHTWYLYLQNNQIEFVSTNSLRNVTQLRWLNLNHNKITSTGVEEGVFLGLSSLLHLYMEDNLLTTVPSPLPPTLEQFRLSRNQISKIPSGTFAGLAHLTLLDLQSNKLQDDSVTEDNLKGLTSLIQINLAKNDLKNMPMGLPPTTTQLFLDSNGIEKIPADYFKDLPKVAFLRLNRNKLVDNGLPKNIFNLSTILDLQLSHNQLTEVPQIPSSLEQLHLNHNQIKSVNGANLCPVSGSALDSNFFQEQWPRLRYLRLDGNEIKPPIPMDLIVCFHLLRAVII